MNGNQQSLGRNWTTADRATLHDFGDCFRAHIYWDDGAEAWALHDTREAALSNLARWGFSKRSSEKVAA
jgi:hypothetical protein